jgi:diguanylate cyclase (GGDEF)-like protein
MNVRFRVKGQPVWRRLLALPPAALSLLLWAAAGFVGESARLLLVYGAGVLTSLAGAMLVVTLCDRRSRGGEDDARADLAAGWHDPLTGLLTRKAFEERMRQAIAGARRHRRTLAVLCLDCDHFKRVNDTFGHQAGDRLLQAVAARIAGCLREDDVVARWGGDEFLAGLVEIRDRQDAVNVAGKLAEALRAPCDIGGHRICVTAAVGVSLFPDDGADIETLIASADRAMYSAKRAGGDGFSCYCAELAEVAKDRRELGQQLAAALDSGQLCLYYQPVYHLQTRKLVALEALLRWKHPERGLLRPDVFLELAEDSGQSPKIGAWDLDAVCGKIRALGDAGCGPVRIAVNVAPRQFLRAGFEETVMHAVRSHRIHPALLELDLSERLLMRDFRSSRRRVDALRRFGVRVTLDDFGTGGASLGDLLALAIDSLKIDRSLIRALGGDPRRAEFIGSIVGLARSLGVAAVAKGVESIPELKALRAAGCEAAQGYLFGMPRPEHEIQRLISGLPVAGYAHFRPVAPRAQNPMWSARHEIEPLAPPAPRAKTALGACLTLAGGAHRTAAAE